MAPTQLLNSVPVKHEQALTLPANYATGGEAQEEDQTR